jgi:hypothetical protein
MKMNRKRILGNVMVFVLILSAIMFFSFPKMEFIPKLFYLALLLGLTVWYFLQRNIKATVTCLIGTAFVILTLPNLKLLKDIEIILIFATWGLGAVIYKRIKNRIP